MFKYMWKNSRNNKFKQHVETLPQQEYFEIFQIGVEVNSSNLDLIKKSKLELWQYKKLVKLAGTPKAKQAYNKYVKDIDFALYRLDEYLDRVKLSMQDGNGNERSLYSVPDILCRIDVGPLAQKNMYVDLVRHALTCNGENIKFVDFFAYSFTEKEMKEFLLLAMDKGETAHPPSII